MRSKWVGWRVGGWERDVTQMYLGEIVCLLGIIYILVLGILNSQQAAPGVLPRQ